MRVFSQQKIEKEKILKILEAGRFAPSGLNNQPWKFRTAEDSKTRELLAKETSYGSVIRSAPVAIAVFLDKSAGYERTKDVLAVGACIQNMLLAAHALGLGGCWLGEILKNKDNVNGILSIPEDCELMAVIALGYGTSKEKPERKRLEELML